MKSFLGIGLPSFGSSSKEDGMINNGGAHRKKCFCPKLRRKLLEIVQILKRQSCPCFGLRALLFCSVILPNLYE
jgi:hypothetical protein